MITLRDEAFVFVHICPQVNVCFCWFMDSHDKEAFLNFVATMVNTFDRNKTKSEQLFFSIGNGFLHFSSFLRSI